MASLKELKAQIKKANALGVANLTEKGVTIPEYATTYDIMLKIAEVSGGGTEYTSIESETDNLFVLTDKKGTEHTIECEYTDGKLTSATYDGKPVDLTYEDDVLVSVGETEIDVSNSGVISTNKLEKTNTDVFLTIDYYTYSKANNEVSILGMYYSGGYTNPLIVSRTMEGARIKRNGTAVGGSVLATTVDGELWYYYCGYGHNKAGTLTQDFTIDVNQYVNDVSTEEAAQTLIRIYLGQFEEDNKDFQNGLIVGMVSGGVVEVEVPAKEEQEKTVTITENGTTEILPDEDKALSKVTVVAEFEGGTEEIKNLIDNSGVLEDTEGSVSEKVEELIDKAEYKKFLSDNLYSISFRNNLLLTELYVPFNNLVSLDYSFAGCKNLVVFKIKGFSKVKSAVRMFEHANILVTVETPLDCSSLNNINSGFAYCWNLTNIKFVSETIKVSISFTNSPLLSAESIQSIIDGLATVETAQTLTLYKDIVLTDEQKATINAKGWTLAQ